MNNIKTSTSTPLLDIDELSEYLLGNLSFKEEVILFSKLLTTEVIYSLDIYYIKKAIEFIDNGVLSASGTILI
jgi:hypothetical protein